MAMKAYVAKTAIRLDGKSFAEGDPIELDEKTEAPQLIAVDAVELAEPGKAAAKA